MPDQWIQTAGLAVVTLGAAAVVNWMMRKTTTARGNNKTYLQMKKKSIKSEDELKEAKWTCVGTVINLWIYPIKSCAGIKVDSAFTAKLGLQEGPIKDRIFMIVNDKGIMITGRIVPSTVLIQPQWKEDLLTLNFPNTDSVTFNVKEVVENAEQRTVRVWNEDVPGLDCGDAVATWLTKILKRSCRLVYHSTLPSPRTTCDDQFPLLQPTDNSYYADLSGHMMMTRESIDDLSTRVTCEISPPNFRPNVLMEGSPAYAEDDWEYVKIGDVIFRNAKPCDRCIFTTINHKTGTKDTNMEPLRTLRTYRCMEGGTAPYFGVNLGLDVAGTVHVGDKIYATYP